MAHIAPLSLSGIASLVQGVIIGDSQLLISGARPLSSAIKNEIAFVADDKHKKDLENTQAGAIIAKPGFRHGSLPIIEVADPFKAFLSIFQHFHPVLAAPAATIHPKAFVHESATIGNNTNIAPHAVIEEGATIGNNCRIHPGVIVGANSRVGDDSILYPNAVLYHGCEVGKRCILHANSVIGADGFGYKFEQGKHIKIPQMAGVIIEDDVEVGAGTAIDRGTFEPTRIGAGTKIDNLVQIGHNCTIGKHNMVVSQVGIGGSTVTGNYVVIAGQVGIADHVHIGDQVKIGAKSGVHQDIDSGGKVLGAPARSEREAKLIWLSMDRLPELRQDVRKIKQHLGMTG